MPSVVAIDQGTTSTRALALDASGAHRLIVALPHQTRTPNAGRVEQDGNELLANIRTCLEACTDLDPLAIGLDNQGESCLAWDAETGDPITPVIVWQDNRTADEIDRLKADGVGALVTERTGLPLESYFSATKLGWILRECPQAKVLHRQGRLHLGTTDAFFLERLTGQFVTDVSTASRTSLMSLLSLNWDADLCDLFGVPMDCLPRIVPTCSDMGTVRLGSGLSVPVLAAAVDQQAALYGHGCRNPGEGKITFGTGAFALMVSGTTVHQSAKTGLLPTVAWSRQGKQGRETTYALDGGVYCAGAAIDWARGLGLFDDYATLSALEGRSALDQGLAFVPALAGLACPHWDRSARGAWIGLAQDHEPQHLMKAVLEGIACRAAEVIGCMSNLMPSHAPLSIDGGLTRNPYFTQFLADLLARPLSPTHEPEVTALGVALMAADTLGWPVGAEDRPPLIKPRQDRQGSLALFGEAVALSQRWGTAIQNQ